LDDQYKFVQENKPALLGDLLKLGDDEAKRRIKIKLYSGETVPSTILATAVGLISIIHLPRSPGWA
jgi:hypothetical protein